MSIIGVSCENPQACKNRATKGMALPRGTARFPYVVGDPVANLDGRELGVHVGHLENITRRFKRGMVLPRFNKPVRRLWRHLGAIWQGLGRLAARAFGRCARPSLLTSFILC